MTEETANKRRYPSASAWAEAEALWASGDVTLEDLAKKVGVSATSVSLHMKKRKITKGEKAKEHSERISKQVAEDILSEGTVHSQRIKETKEEHYKMATGLARLTWNEIVTAKAKGGAYAAIQQNLKALEIASNVLAKIRQERYAVLGLDKPDAVDATQLPELVIEELTADQVQQLKERDFNNGNYDFEDVDMLEPSNDSGE